MKQIFATLMAVILLGMATPAAQDKGKVRADGKTLSDQQIGETIQKLQPQQADPRDDMRRFIRKISRTARRLKSDFVVLTQGGLELLEKIDAIDTTRSVPSSTYIRALDGIVVRSLFLHPPIIKAKGVVIRTEEKVKAEMLRLADLAKRRGLRVLVTDFVGNATLAQEVLRRGAEKGYVPFAATGAGYIFNRIPPFPRRPFEENPRNVTGMKQVRNFLYITDSSHFDRQEDFVLTLNNTNFDAVVIDVFHRGRKPFTKRSVRGMKFKKLGARRLVLAQMNIGEADSFRYYWKSDWREGSPSFLASPKAGNPDTHYVRYWDPAWQKIIAGDVNSYLYGIFAQGFDGVVIDGVEAYRFFEGTTQQ